MSDLAYLVFADVFWGCTSVLYSFHQGRIVILFYFIFYFTPSHFCTGQAR
uniref:Uncharacterized protein n=1 Tax=Anguilla anguilla TaxID=7936 RepID=A0A0E9R1P3_ANGAN